MKGLKITKHEELGDVTYWIPYSSIKAIEFQRPPNYIKIYYLDKIIDGHIDVNNFEIVFLLQTIENNIGYYLSLWDNLEDSPERIEDFQSTIESE